MQRVQQRCILASLVFVFGCFALTSAAVPADASGLEYRFKAPDGVEYRSRAGATEKLENQPFMSGPDFSNAIEIKSNTRSTFEIDIVHNQKGKQKYRANVESGEPREYRILFNETVLQCNVLETEFPALYAKGGTIYGPFTKPEAVDLTTQINRTMHRLTDN